MKIAVLSGKGGAGKTFVSVNLAYNLKNSVYVDCDVEEPNGRLFIKPKNIKEEKVYAIIPEFNGEKCNGCKKCVELCNFNALIYIKNKPKLFTEVCHGCGLCEMVCPQNAITEVKRPIGIIEIGGNNNITSVTGVLNLGEASGVGVIKAALEKAEEMKNNIIIDCPPGSACSVSESLKNADFCVIVAEATNFGFHNFKMVYELTKVLNKKCGVIINKYDGEFKDIFTFCKDNEIPVLGEIPYKKEIAKLTSKGEIASKFDEETKEKFSLILEKIGGLVK